MTSGAQKFPLNPETWFAIQLGQVPIGNTGDSTRQPLKSAFGEDIANTPSPVVKIQ
jgi:hypothetical protein